MKRGMRFTVSRKAYGSPRSVTSNAHGFRIAVHRVTGEIRILYSVHATDAGVVINPQQVRGQIEGGVAQAIGFALTENFHVDENGVMVNPNLRNYRIPTYADVPRTEVLLVETHDSVGPMKAKGIAESNVNPVAPALANALHDATGIRYRDLPFTPERIYARLDSATVDGRDLNVDTRKPTDTAATVIIGQRVRAGSEQAFEAWQQEMNSEASKYPGFIAAEISPPTAVQRDWVVVFRFDSIAHVQAWINSAARQERLAAGAQFFEGPGTQQVVGGGARQADPLVTVVITHRVKPENLTEFLAWQDRLRSGGEQVSRVSRHRTVSPR